MSIRHILHWATAWTRRDCHNCILIGGQDYSWWRKVPPWRWRLHRICRLCGRVEQ